MTARDLDAIYTREWYEHDFPGLESEFALVAAGIDRWAVRLGAKGWSALDVGCGPGMLVGELRRRGFKATGFDGSQHAIDYARDHLLAAVPYITRADLLDCPRESADLVVCTEVAEHVPAEHAARLVGYLASCALEAIVFTAAPPGQGGHDHVNEQPREYWSELFAEHGWIEDHRSTGELRSRWAELRRLSHMIRNVMVFR